MKPENFYLTGDLAEKLSKAIVFAFGDYNNLRQFVYYKFDWNLNEKTSDGNLKNASFELIQWANEEGRQYELVKKLNQEKPNNSKIQDFLRKINFDISSEQKEITKYFPLCPECFIGREDKLLEIADRLNNGHDIVLINGIGGVGKSAIALYFAHQSLYGAKYNHIAWISIKTGLLKDIIATFNQVLEINLTSYKTDEERGLELIEKLRIKYNGNILLIIDNANNVIELENSRDLLRRLRWKIIITSRCTPDSYKPDTIWLKELSNKEAKRLFLHYYLTPEQDRESFDEPPELNILLEQIYNHTLLCELLAKIGNKKPLTIEELYKIVKNTGFDNKNLKAKIDAGMHAKLTDKERITVLHEYISELFLPETLSNDEKEVLQRFSILPSVDISLKYLLDIFNVDGDNQEIRIEGIFDNLQQSGWLLQNKLITSGVARLSYKIHSLVQLVVREKLKPNIQIWNELINSLNQIFKKESTNGIAFHLYLSTLLSFNHAVLHELKDDLKFISSDKYLEVFSVLKAKFHNNEIKYKEVYLLECKYNYAKSLFVDNSISVLEYENEMKELNITLKKILNSIDKII